MAYNRSLPAETLSRIEAVIASDLPGADARLRFSVEYVLARVLTMASFEMESFIEWVSRQILATTCDDDILSFHGEFWGVERREAATASGAVTFTGLNGAVIPAATLLRRADGTEFMLNADVTIASGTGTGTVTASISGAAGNAQSGTTLSLISPVPGVQTSATAGTISGGVDVESIQSWRTRIVERVQTPPHGGNADDYVTWAKQVPGVTRAWPYPKQLGIGTMLVLFVMDDKPDTIIPTSEEVDTVKTYIETQYPVTADLYVEAPVAVPVDFEINLFPNTVAVRQAVQEELKDFFQRESEPGGALMLSRIKEAISVAAGEYHHELIEPSDNVLRSFGEISVLGEITFEDVA